MNEARFNRGDEVEFDCTEGRLCGVVEVVDDRRGEERHFGGSLWSYDICTGDGVWWKHISEGRIALKGGSDD